MGRAIWKGQLIGSPSDTPGSVRNIAAGTISKFGLPPWSWRRAMTNLSLALGLAVAGAPNDASALDVGPVAQAPSTQWCLVQRGSDQPACYENLITCVMAALAHAGSCSQRPSVPPSQAATTQRAPAIAPRHRTHTSSPHKFGAAERDELFHEFQKWQARAPHE